MGFLQSAFLAGLALVSVPLILHLFTRRRVQQVRFPALMLLGGSKRRSMSILTLQQLLVLLCRTAAIGLVALAFALPVLRGVRLSLPGTRTRVALHIIIDNSASMGWRRRGVAIFDRAKSAAEKLVAGASQEDEVTVEFACGGPGTTLNPEKAIELIRATKPGDCRAPLDLKINRTIHSLRSSLVPERRLVLLSDFQENGFGLKPPAHKKGDARVIGVDFASGERGNNARITGVELPMFPLVGEDVAVCFRIESDMRPGSAIASSLTVDGRKRGEQAAGLDKAGRARGCFSVTIGEKGRHSGAVSISGDSLPGDNDRYFVFDVHEEIPVLLAVSADSLRDPADGAFYLASAIRTIAAGQGGRPIRLTIAAPGELDAKTVSANRVVIVPGAGALSNQSVSLLGDYVAEGGGLFLIASRGAHANAVISKTLFGGGVTINAETQEEASHAGSGPGGYVTIGQIDTGHPVFRGLSGEVGAALKETRFYDPVPMSVSSPDITVPLVLSDGAALLAERRVGRGRVMLLASDAAPAATNLPLKPVFVPFIIRLCKYLGESVSDAQRDFTLGHDVRLELDVPDGVTSLKARKLESGGEFVLRRPPDGGSAFTAADGRAMPAGAYEVTGADGRRIDMFTVNSDPEESDLKSLSKAAWNSRYGEYDARFLDAARFTDAERLKELVYVRHASALWFPFLLAAILFLFLEMIISNRK
jgi:hypothetical protein